MGSYRYFVGSVLAFLCLAPGCSNLIGLSGYSVGGLGGQAEAGSEAEAGRRGKDSNGGSTSVGSAGDSSEEAGEAGAAGAGQVDDGGASAIAGSAGTAGNSGSAGTAGGAGTAGNPGACPDDCNDANDCTSDACVAGKCMHQALSVTTPCGTSRICDSTGACVRCLDTAPGTGDDLGCPATAPVCVGTGADSACGGCTVAADCADSNECTTEQCNNSKCVISAVPAGQMCTTGVCNGVAPEQCTVCADTATGRSQDAGCTSAKPICDPTGNGACYACVQDSDCASDNVSCTVETCTNHLCSHVATDSKCTPSGDVCKPNKCNATLDCKQVDISTKPDLITADENLGNGSFENGEDDGNAALWTNTGSEALIFDCTGDRCEGSVDTILPDDGNLVAWFGGTADAAIDQLDHALTLPAGTTTLSIKADMNVQTENSDPSNLDRFDIFLLDASKTQIGQAVFSVTNTTAQTSTAVWTLNQVNKPAVNVSAQAGKKIYLRLRSSVDGSWFSDFFIDNVRVTATVCQ